MVKGVGLSMLVEAGRGTVNALGESDDPSGQVANLVEQVCYLRGHRSVVAVVVVVVTHGCCVRIDVQGSAVVASLARVLWSRLVELYATTVSECCRRKVGVTLWQLVVEKTGK